MVELTDFHWFKSFQLEAPYVVLFVQIVVVEVRAVPLNQRHSRRKVLTAAIYGTHLILCWLNFLSRCFQQHCLLSTLHSFFNRQHRLINIIGCVADNLRIKGASGTVQTNFITCFRKVHFMVVIHYYLSCSGLGWAKLFIAGGDTYRNCQGSFRRNCSGRPTINLGTKATFGIYF
jgi:hypothetical protein